MKTATIPTTSNEANGFYGTAFLTLGEVETDAAWETAYLLLRNAAPAGTTPEEIAAYLDSRDGRHLADAMVSRRGCAKRLPPWLTPSSLKIAFARLRKERQDRSPETGNTVADALRAVAKSLTYAIASGHKSRMIDADRQQHLEDLFEVLLAIADRLDPPLPDTTNEVVCPCPDCGMADADRLVWQDDEFVRCDACGTIYAPDA